MWGLTLQQLAFFAILLAAFALLITERLRNDVVAVLIILALYLTGVLKSDEALSGLGSEPAVIVAGIFVLGSAIHLTGLSDTLGGLIGRVAGGSYTRITAVMMSSVALFSAFTHHVTTTAVMLPVTLNLAREHGIPASKLLMPLSFAASLGTTITIIGAPAFLISDALLRQAGRPGLSVFSIAPIGLVLSLAGTLYMLTVGRWMLPSRQGVQEPGSRFRLDEYLTELSILPDSPFLGKTIDEIESDSRYKFKVSGLVRNKLHIGRPLDRPLQEGDVLLIRTPPEEMVAIREEPNVELDPLSKYADEPPAVTNQHRDIDEALVQAVVSPNSDLIGRTVGDIDFRQRYGVIVVGFWRQEGWLTDALARIRLRAGDVLVLQGDEDALNRVGGDRSFLMLVPFQGQPQMRRKAYLAGGIMLVTILLAAFNVVDLQMAVLAGALGVILTRCITPRQAYRAIDPRIYVFIAGAIPLGAAMEKTGSSKLMAGWLQSIVQGWNTYLVLFGMFIVVAILTQFMSDSGTVALFGPVAIALARALGQPPEPFVVTVAMAAVAAFLTPIGHHGNLLVYGPGGYRFRDFVTVGTPLTLLVGVIVILLAPVIWRA